jgi:hypothetical protein
MEESSMPLENTLLASRKTAKVGEVYVGWPARRLVSGQKRNTNECDEVFRTLIMFITCMVLRLSSSYLSLNRLLTSSGRWTHALFLRRILIC